MTQTAARGTNPWVISGSVHAAVLVIALLLGMAHRGWLNREIEITLVDAPRALPKAVEISKPKVTPQVMPRQVFGSSRKAITTDDGLDVKQGNTVAKAPDNEKLLPSDADSVPIPTEDYLVTQMPAMEHEVVIPYPPEVKKRGVQGAVIMDLVIDSTGKVRKADLVEGPDPALNQAALSAAMGFKFRPAMMQDKAVAVKIRYAYRFVIRG